MAYPNNNYNQRPNQGQQSRPPYQAPAAPLNQVDGTKDFDPVETGRSLVAQLKTDNLLRDFTTSQLRKVLSSANVVKNRIDREAAEAESLSASIQEEIQYLRLRLVYQMGREPKVKLCLGQKGVDLPAVIKNIGADKKKFNDFYRLLESIVAYRKFEGE